MPSWYPADYYIQPKYESYPDLILVDVAAPRLRPRRRNFWEKARDKAIAGWAECGVSFEIIEQVTGYNCGEITLDLYDTDDGTKGQAATLYPPLPFDCTEGAWARVDLEWFQQQWMSKVAAPLQAVIGHELGHTLGFGHGGTGIMAPYATERIPNAEECSALRAYWET